MSRAIVVTGASKGIGRASADLLAESGWAVIGIARNRPEDFPGDFIEVDLSDMAALTTFSFDLAKRPNVLGIVNNAGAARAEAFGEVDPAEMLDLIAFNLRPALQLTQAILPNMQRAGFGRVINVTSLVTRGLPFRASYAASKAALESLTRTIAIEQAAYGITANAVAPGPTETELFRSNNPAGGAGEARYLAQIPLGRLGAPREVAAAINFLASQGAGFMTGQTLFVDGGASLGAALTST